MPNSARKKEVLETLDYSKSILSEAKNNKFIPKEIFTPNPL